MKSVTYTVLGSLAVCAALTTGCTPPAKDGAEKGAPGSTAGKAEAKAPKVRPVELLTVDAAPFAEAFEVTGNLSAIDDVVVAARGSGSVLSVVPRGTRLEADEVIAKVDPALSNAGAAQARASIRLAQASLSLAQDTIARQKPLYEKGIISGLEYRRMQGQVDQARAQLAQARASAQSARTQVRYTEVRAPFAGVVEKRLTERGEQLAPGQPVVRLVNTDRLRVKAGVPERYARDVAVGQTAQMDFSTYGLPSREGTISFVAQSIDPASRTFPVEIDLDNTDGALKPEMSVRVKLTRAGAQDALVVPQTAVLRDVNGDSLFIVEQRGGAGEAPSMLSAKRVPVKLGPSSGGRVVVASGLTAGTQVVVRGQASLTTGDRVRVEQRAAAAPNPDTDTSTTRIDVHTRMPDVDAQKVEAAITTPLEAHLRAVPGVKQLRSTTKAGLAVINVEFDGGIQPDEARARLKSSMATFALPKGAVSTLKVDTAETNR